MAVVFISHVLKDRAAAAELAAALQEHALTASSRAWDQELAGQRPEITVGQASAVVVLWSSSSLSNETVFQEATLALLEEKLAPARIEGDAVALDFAFVPTCDLTSWTGDRDHAGLKRLITNVRSKVAGRGEKGSLRATPSNGPATSRPRRQHNSPHVPPPTQREKIFLSYRRDDTLAVSGRVSDQLIAAFGVDRVVFDLESTPIGVDFRDHIRSEIAKCHSLVAVIGPNWIGRTEDRVRLQEEDDYVRLELREAIEHSVRIFPVLVGGATMPPPNVFPAELARISFLNAAELDVGRDFHIHMRRLIREISD